jgi:hypothetical protein
MAKVKAKDGKDWIEDMHTKKGALREKVGAKKGKDISKKQEAHAEKSKNGTERKEANLAAELSHFRHDK